eukprot:CAMPEP_0176281264 /NCGR_PEP_ID=MMETSP0121_2-20121125/50208_1 /TAXON_ID=160619 /ORGANISM="Kryptoperidinium foliaceum, Strain CCMP 1326" /LENGTH=38 /DNA_ID= /DNA_START= /DNA_END= /DNA_ORIENTATION=
MQESHHDGPAQAPALRLRFCGAVVSSSSSSSSSPSSSS